MKIKNLLPIIVFSAILSSAQNTFSPEYKKSYYEREINSISKEIDAIKYTPDFGDYWQTPEETIAKGTGDCEDKATLDYKQLKEKGLDVNMVWGKMKKEDKKDHIWLEYEIGRDSYIIETSVKTKIIPRSTINKDSYVYSAKSKYSSDKIKEFGKRSGLELKFKNKGF